MSHTVKTVEIGACNNCGSNERREVGQARDFEYDSGDNEYSFVECLRCGMQYLRNRPDVSELGTIYPPNYRPHQFNKVLGPFISSIRDRVQLGKVKRLRRFAGPEAVVVDVGCGSGELLRLARDYGDPSWRLIGIDFSEKSVAAVRALGLTARQGRFEAIDWKDEPPDLIFMSHVIEHLDDPGAVVRKAFDLLKPGGFFVVETPSSEGLDAAVFRRRYWGGWHCPRHWHIYNERTLQRAMTAAGFEIAETAYLLSPNFLLQSLHHVTKERLGAPGLAKIFDSKHFVPLLCAAAFSFLQRALLTKTSNMRVVGRKPAR